VVDVAVQLEEAAEQERERLMALNVINTEYKLMLADRRTHDGDPAMLRKIRAARERLLRSV
jgi:hypothetical protein